MGVSTFIYVGPYICSTSVNTTTTKNVMTCSNEKCNVHKKRVSVNGKFCSDCGSVVSPLKYVVCENRVLRFWDIFADNNITIPENLKFIDADDEFSMNDIGGKMVWLLNKKEACKQIPHLSFSPDYSDEMIDMPDSLNKENAISKFIDYYGEFIDYINQHFNVNLDVKYGMLVYYG